MLLKNAMVCHSDFQFRRSDIHIKGKIIDGVYSVSDAQGPKDAMSSVQCDSACALTVSGDVQIIDIGGYYAVPGYIDIHVHGGGGADTCDDSATAVFELSSHLARYGVSSFCATTMTIDEPSLMAALTHVDHYFRDTPNGAKLIGVHLEGPFLSPSRSGVQSSEVLQLPEINLVNKIESRFPGLLKIIDVAPELPGADEFIRTFSKDYALSISHSDADYDITRRAVALGLRHATHLYNAMRPIHHKAPGPVCAILEDSSVTAELICDLVHIHPSLLALTFKILGPNRAVIVSDAMRGAGMPDGKYKLGNALVKVYNGRTDFGDGRLAGSVSSVAEGVRNLVSIGVPLEDAIRAATINPARVIGVGQMTGSIEEGKLADITILDDRLIPVLTICEGRIIYQSTMNTSTSGATIDRNGENVHD